MSQQTAGSGAGLTREAVMEALKTVNDPELHRDLVSLGMVKQVQVEAGVARVEIQLTTPACPLKDVIGGDVRKALATIPGFEDVIIDFTANVAGRAMEDQDLAPGVKNIVGIASGKGGVGKSTVALNLAISLQRTGARVGLLDADIYGPNIPTMMALRRAPRVEDNKMIPLERFDLKMISMGLLIQDDTPVIWRGPMLNSALRQFFGDVRWGELDYLLVDLPPGTGDVQISMVQLVRVTGCVIVTTPQRVAVEDARRGLAMFHQTNTPVLGIIENMGYFRCGACDEVHHLFGDGGGERAAKELEVPFLGSIPLAVAVREGGDAGEPITVADPEGEISQKFLDVARQLAARISVHNIESDTQGPLEINLGPR